jgi:hypothetical protein
VGDWPDGNFTIEIDPEPVMIRLSPMILYPSPTGHVGMPADWSREVVLGVMWDQYGEEWAAKFLKWAGWERSE